MKGNVIRLEWGEGNMKKNGQKSDAIYRELKEQIIFMDIEPGSALSEIDSAAKYKISRTPVRDSFKRLELDGLLEVRSHIGSFVTQIDLDHIADVLYIREKVEFACMKELMNRLSYREKLKIEFNLDKQHQLLNSEIKGRALAREFNILDNEFHQLIFEFSSHSKIWEYIHSLEYDYQRFRVFLNITEHKVLEQLYLDHMTMFGYILAADEDKLEVLFHNHLNDGFREGLKKAFQSPEFFKNLSDIG